MRVLYVAPYIPSRIRVRTYSLITALAARGHEVSVLALRDTNDERQLPGLDEVRQAVRNLEIIDHPKHRAAAQAMAALPTSSPMCTAYCWSRQMSKHIQEIVETRQADVVHIEHLRAAHFRPKNRQIPVVVDAVDCLTTLFAQMAAARDAGPAKRLVMAEEAWKLRRYEPRTLAQFDHVMATTESERNSLLALDAKMRVSVVPNGVDSDYFRPSNKRPNPNRIIFTGKMSYAPNAQAAVWFARSVLPLIQHTSQEAEFVIAGSSPPREVMELGELANVRVTGFVDDLREELAASAVAVAPMLMAAGIQNKILEAMAMEVPVITNAMAARPLGDRCPGILVADSAEEMARAASALLCDPEMASRVGKEGREQIEKRFSWNASAAQLEEIYQRLPASP